MKRKGLLATGLALAGVELFNKRVTIPREELEPQLPVEPEMWSWRFGDVAVYKAGDSSNPPLLMMHGHNAAGSATEMREPFARLSKYFYVYAPDLLGYGLSDRPDIEYTPALYVEFMQDILREVVQRPAHVFASSLTSAHAIEAAYRDPEWVLSLVLSCPTGVRTLVRQSGAGKAVGAVLALPLIGQAFYNAIASRPSIRYFLEAQTYFDTTLVTDELVDAYYRTSHVPGSKYAPSAFVSGKLYWDASEAWSRLEQRVLMVWGKEGGFTPPSDALPFLALNPAAESVEIGAAGVLPHDEQPEVFANLVGDWLQSL